MQIFNLQIPKNDLARREIRKYRVIWLYWQPNPIDLYIEGKQFTKHQSKLWNKSAEYSPSSIAIKGNLIRARFVEFLQFTNKICHNSLHIEFPCSACCVRRVQYRNTSLYAPSLEASPGPAWWKPGPSQQLLSPAPARCPRVIGGSWSRDQIRCLARDDSERERKYKTSTTARVFEMVGVSL